MQSDLGSVNREPREAEFELISRSDSRRVYRGWTSPSKRFFPPSKAESTPELRFEVEFVWLPVQRGLAVMFHVSADSMVMRPVRSS